MGGLRKRLRLRKTSQIPAFAAFASPSILRFNESVTEDLQKRIQQALANPQNMGELANADAIGTVGNSDCGEMLRMW